MYDPWGCVFSITSVSVAFNPLEFGWFHHELRTAPWGSGKAFSRSVLSKEQVPEGIVVVFVESSVDEWIKKGIRIA